MRLQIRRLRDERGMQAAEGAAILVDVFTMRPKAAEFLFRTNYEDLVGTA